MNIKTQTIPKKMVSGAPSVGNLSFDSLGDEQRKDKAINNGPTGSAQYNLVVTFVQYQGYEPRGIHTDTLFNTFINIV